MTAMAGKTETDLLDWLSSIVGKGSLLLAHRNL